LGTGAEIVATSCPYCLIMLDDAVNAKRAEGGADGVTVIDIAQVIADSIGLRKVSAAAAATDSVPANGRGESGAPKDETADVAVHQPAEGAPAVESDHAAGSEPAQPPPVDGPPVDPPDAGSDADRASE
jgi:hypothetical protein